MTTLFKNVSNNFKQINIDKKDMKGLTRTATFTFSAIVSALPRKFCRGMTAVTCRAHVDSVGNIASSKCIHKY